MNMYGNFLDNFIETNDEVKDRMATLDTFGQPLDNVANDVRDVAN